MKREVTVKCKTGRVLSRVYLKRAGTGFEIIVNATNVGEVFKSDRPSKASTPWAAASVYGKKGVYVTSPLAWSKTALQAVRGLLCKL